MLKRLWWSFTDYFRETDKILLALCTICTLFGSVAVLSTTRYLGNERQFFTHLIAMVLGLIVAMVISHFDYSIYKKWWPVFAAVSVILVGLTFFIGFAPQGTDSKAWIRIAGNLTFQPSEIMKIAFIISFSVHLGAIGDKLNKIPHLALVLLHAAFPVVFIVIQKDFGTALVFAIIVIIMLVVAGLKKRYFAILGGTLLLSSPIIYFFVLSDYHKNRINLMFNLESDLLGTGYQQWRGRIALANGGIFGKGLFNGPLTQSGNVPESYNDFIFVSIGEELGLIGCLAVIGLLAAVCGRILLTGKRARDKEGTLLCAGVFAMFLAQIFINLGMCLSILPVIGVTLPFFSAGGTSLVCLYMGIGVVLSVFLHKDSNLIRVL